MDTADKKSLLVRSLGPIVKSFKDFALWGRIVGRIAGSDSGFGFQEIDKWRIRSLSSRQC